MKEDVDLYTALIRERATMVSTCGQTFGCADPDDDVVIGSHHKLVSGSCT